MLMRIAILESTDFKVAISHSTIYSLSRLLDMYHIFTILLRTMTSPNPKIYERRRLAQKIRNFEDWFRCLLILFCLKTHPSTECCCLRRLVASTVNVNRDSCVRVEQKKPTDRPIGETERRNNKTSFIGRIESRLRVSKKRWLLLFLSMHINWEENKTCIVRHHDERRRKRNNLVRFLGLRSAIAIAAIAPTAGHHTASHEFAFALFINVCHNENEIVFETTTQKKKY